MWVSTNPDWEQANARSTEMVKEIVNDSQKYRRYFADTPNKTKHLIWFGPTPHPRSTIHPKKLKGSSLSYLIEFENSILNSPNSV